MSALKYAVHIFIVAILYLPQTNAIKVNINLKATAFYHKTVKAFFQIESFAESRLLEVQDMVKVVLRIYNFTREVEAFIEDRVDEIEDFIEDLREDNPPLDVLVIFVEMGLALYEVVRSFLQIFDFVGNFVDAVIEAFKDVNKFLVAVELEPIDVGFEIPP